MSPSVSPVHWSWESLSAVADSEVTHRPIRRPCIYFKLPLRGSLPAYIPSSNELTESMPVYFVSWTSTPFTVPANRALAVSPSAEYALLRVSPLISDGQIPCEGSLRCCDTPYDSKHEIWVVGKKRVSTLIDALKAARAPYVVQQIGSLAGHQLANLR